MDYDAIMWRHHLSHKPTKISKLPVEKPEISMLRSTTSVLFIKLVLAIDYHQTAIFASSKAVCTWTETRFQDGSRPNWQQLYVMLKVRSKRTDSLLSRLPISKSYPDRQTSDGLIFDETFTIKINVQL